MIQSDKKSGVSDFMEPTDTGTIDYKDVLDGMNDVDNGHAVTSSSIVAYTLDGAQQVLTSDGIMAMYPYASANGKKIVCSTLQTQTSLPFTVWRTLTRIL